MFKAEEALKFSHSEGPQEQKFAANTGSFWVPNGSILESNSGAQCSKEIGL